MWESMSTKDLCITICTWRLDPKCNPNTFVSLVEELESRIQESKDELIRLLSYLNNLVEQWEAKASAGQAGGYSSCAYELKKIFERGE